MYSRYPFLYFFVTWSAAHFHFENVSMDTFFQTVTVYETTKANQKQDDNSNKQCYASISVKKFAIYKKIKPLDYWSIDMQLLLFNYYYCFIIYKLWVTNCVLQNEGHFFLSFELLFVKHFCFIKDFRHAFYFCRSFHNLNLFYRDNHTKVDNCCYHQSRMFIKIILYLSLTLALMKYVAITWCVKAQ